MVTDADGRITQNVVYIPYGELFVEERNGSWASPYLFNAKELDEETGLYYYGARYLNPSIALWLSTDPLQGKYPGMSPYNYCAGNPVKLVDPDGRDWVQNKETKEIVWKVNCTSEEDTPKDFDYIGNEYLGLSVIGFNAYSDGKNNGLFIALCYNNKSKNSEYQWIQSIKTNIDKNSERGQFEYIDSNENYPFYFTKEQQKQFTSFPDCTYGFTDTPTRGSRDLDTDWKGELTLVQQTKDGFKPIFTVSYGFLNDSESLRLYNLKFSEQSEFQKKVLDEVNKKFSLESNVLDK